MLALLTLASSAGAQEKPSVWVVSYPLEYFARRIGGDAIRVELPAPRGVDPAVWSPSADEVAGYQNADLVLLNGAGYARWVERVSLRRSRLVDTSAGFRDAYIRRADAVTHSHGPEGPHSHGALAFTTWLDFRQAALQAGAVAEALAGRVPERGEEFRAAFASLEADLLALDAEVERIVAADRKRPLLAPHPVYAYLARRHGLNLESVTWEPDAVPSEAEWSALATRLAERPAAWMLWEAPPRAQIRERLEALGVTPVVFDPAGRRPDEGDFLGVMRRNLRNLRAAFE